MEGTIRESVNVSSTTPVQLKQCTKLSGEYVVLLNPRGSLNRILSTFLCRIEGICLLGVIFCVFWAFFAIVGAIHYRKWYPRFDLKDVHIRSFNVTPARELNYDMDILIEARHFSRLRRIEQYSYEIRTSHVGTRIGASSVPGFHPIRNETMEVSSTQNVSLFPLGDKLGDLVRADLNATGRVALRLYIEGQIYTPLFLAQKKRRGWTCDLIVSPVSPFGSQIVHRMCCKNFPCLIEGWIDGHSSTGIPTQTWGCKEEAPSCCRTRPADLRSTNKIC